MISAQRTLSGMIIFGLLNLAVPFGLAATPSLPSSPQGSSVSGTLMSRVSEDGDWKAASVGQDVKSQWFKTGPDSEAVIAFAGDVHMRMSPNTVVHVESSSEAGLRVEVPQGDVLTTVPDSGKTPVHLTTPNGNVGSSSGSFIVKVDEKKVALEVLEGNATLSGNHVTSEQLPGVDMQSMAAAPGLLAEAQPVDPPTKPDESQPDDPNTTNDDNQDDDNTGMYVAGGGALALLIALLLGNTNTQSNGGNGTPASP